MVPTPQQLGMTKTLAFVAAPIGQMFFYKKRVSDKCDGNIQVIETANEDAHRYRRLPGPFVYAVADSGGQTRYLGKSLEAFLYSVGSESRATFITAKAATTSFLRLQPAAVPCGYGARR